MLVAVVERHITGNTQRDGILNLLVEPVGEPLQEQDGEDVVLVVGRIDLAAQDVGSLLQLGLKLLSAQCHGYLLWIVGTVLRPISSITESRSVSRRNRAASTVAAYAASDASRATVSRSCGDGTET